MTPEKVIIKIKLDSGARRENDTKIAKVVDKF